MKKVIFGVGMLLGGIIGIGFVFLCTACNGDGNGVAAVFEYISYMGLGIPFLFFAILIIAGLVIAYKETYGHKQNDIFRIDIR